ncbi:MAG: nitroreductase family deazaflavin-dependent oxidoreductase [Actinomycetota bacterium]|nr:nitroreductase family deazaflavin-dependent oxidoreductase [Actinomycetota bacterium]
MALRGEYEPSRTDWVRQNVEAFEASNGSEASELNGYPIVVITSVGAKSGKLRKNPVMRVERDGKYVAIASKGGAPDNPEWYSNYRAHPEVELQDKSVKKTYRPRLVEGDERTEWWQLAVDTWPTYAEYQKKTERQIPVFVLEPVE